MAAASNGGSAGLAVWPVSGSVTVSASPPAVVAMTGDVPAAYASRGNAAERLGAGRDDNVGQGGVVEQAADAG